MARVIFPPGFREWCGGLTEVEIDAPNLARLIDALELRFPDLAGQLRESDRIKPGLSIVIDGAFIYEGLFAALNPNSEVHFLPAISGGTAE